MNAGSNACFHACGSLVCIVRIREILSLICVCVCVCLCVCVSVFFLCVCVFVLLKHTSWTSSLFVSAITTSSLAGVLNHPPQVLRCSVESAPPSPSPSSSPDGLAPCLSGGERGGSARERVLPREGNLLRTRTLPARWTAPARRPHHAPFSALRRQRDGASVVAAFFATLSTEEGGGGNVLLWSSVGCPRPSRQHPQTVGNRLVDFYFFVVWQVYTRNYAHGLVLDR